MSEYRECIQSYRLQKQKEKRMFGFLKKNNQEIKIYAPLSGEVVAISEVRDEVFSKKMLGEGVAIIPSSGKLYAPADGTLVSVFKTKHAYTILTDDGLELLIHCGLDTVELAGEGFTVYKNSGDRIRTGELIAEMDLERILAHRKETITPIVITNSDQITNLQFKTKTIASGELLLTVFR